MVCLWINIQHHMKHLPHHLVIVVNLRHVDEKVDYQWQYIRFYTKDVSDRKYLVLRYIMKTNDWSKFHAFRHYVVYIVNIMCFSSNIQSSWLIAYFSLFIIMFKFFRILTKKRNFVRLRRVVAAQVL